MGWINPIDKLPQVPRDWANHVIYGGALGLLALAGGLNADDSALAVLGVAAAKKTVDYIREGESWKVCVGKALVTAAWPLSLIVARGLLHA